MITTTQEPQAQDRLTARCTTCGWIGWADEGHVCGSRVPAALATRERRVSPCCSVPLNGGPVIFTCTGCGHDVHGSAIDREVTLAGGAR